MKASKSRIREVSNNSSEDLKKTLNANRISKMGTESMIIVQSNCLMTKSKNVSSDDNCALIPKTQRLEDEDEAFFLSSNGHNTSKKKLRTRNTIDLSSCKISPRTTFAPQNKSSKKKNRKLHFMNLRQDSVFNHVDTGLNSYQIDENIKKAHESNTLKEINESQGYHAQQ